MHEAELAIAVANELRKPGVRGRPVSLLVSGGHSDVDAFDAALRLHLAAHDPELDLDAISIVHIAEERLCLDCSRPFAAVGLAADCPRCGGVGLAQPRPEQIEVELS